MVLPLEHAQYEVDSVSEDHNSQNFVISTHASPALASLPQPEEYKPAASPSLPPQLPPARSPSLPSQLPPVTPLPRTPPVRNSRRRTSGSPRSPFTTLRRASLRARTNRISTPFERAADLLASVELRRLVHEEARDKRLHEREMVRLRVEAERIAVSKEKNNLLYRLSLHVQQLIDVIKQQRPSS